MVYSTNLPAAMTNTQNLILRYLETVPEDMRRRRMDELMYSKMMGDVSQQQANFLRNRLQEQQERQWRNWQKKMEERGLGLREREFEESAKSRALDLELKRMRLEMLKRAARTRRGGGKRVSRHDKIVSGLANMMIDNARAETPRPPSGDVSSLAQSDYEVKVLKNAERKLEQNISMNFDPEARAIEEKALKRIRQERMAREAAAQEYKSEAARQALEQPLLGVPQRKKPSRFSQLLRKSTIPPAPPYGPLGGF